MGQCLSRQTVSDYARDRLPVDENAAAELHLAECTPCLEAVVEAGQDGAFPTLTNCHIIKELGSGRFGVVYKAWWFSGTPKLVALKCLSFAGDMERERFEREVTVLKQINSPNIVKCLDSGTSAGTSYYVMDLITGVHLDEFLEMSTSTLGERLAVFQRVCAAVAEAHARGVIHRDLKPRNILIDSKGEPRILDFGICALAPHDWGSSLCNTITRTGDIVGTLKYMSPEQAWGGVGRPIDERSDVWALGIMLYEIVTNGDYPYSMGPTPDKPAHDALLERIRKDMPTLPRLRSIDRGQQLETLLERCLSWEPHRRLGTARVLAADIGRYLAGNRIKTKPFSIPYRISRLGVGIATKSRWAALLTLVAGVAFTLAASTYLFDVRWLAGAGAGNRAVASSKAGINPQQEMVVAGVYDSTADSLVKFARAHGIPAVDHRPKSWRAIHGYLMQRLVSAKPRAVVWDYYFRTPQPGDEELVRGAQSLEAAGVPVVLAAFTYDNEGNPDLSPAIRAGLGDRLHHGAIVARDMVELEGEFVLAIKRPDQRLIPGLALAAFAAMNNPNARLDIDWSGRAKNFDMLYETRPGAYLRERDRVQLTKVFQNKIPHASVRAGDLLGCKTFELRTPARWEEATVPYESLLTMSAEQLRDAVKDKVLLIGDLRQSRAGFRSDRHAVRYGRMVIHDVPGVYLMGDAISGLLADRYLKSAFIPLPATLTLMLVLATIGCMVPLKFATRKYFEPQRNRNVLLISLAGLSAACYAAMCVAESYQMVHLGMAGCALLAPMCGSFMIEFSRNRHLILDAKRKTVESLQLEDDRTLTLPRWPTKPLPAEQ